MHRSIRDDENAPANRNEGRLLSLSRHTPYTDFVEACVLNRKLRQKDWHDVIPAYLSSRLSLLRGA